jgi:hypothetical protein
MQWAKTSITALLLLCCLTGLIYFVDIDVLYPVLGVEDDERLSLSVHAKEEEEGPSPVGNTDFGYDPRFYEKLNEENKDRLIRPMRLSNLPFVQEYIRIYELMRNGTIPKRFVYAFDGDGTGFGNKMRQFSSSFLVALLTQRMWVTSYSVLIDAWDSPLPSVPWVIDDVPGFREMDNDKDHVPRKSLRAISEDEYRVFTPESVADFPILYIGEGSDLITDPLAMNPVVAPRIQELFNCTAPKILRSFLARHIINFLLRRPSNWFAQALNATVNDMNFFPGTLAVFAPPDVRRQIQTSEKVDIFVTVRRRFLFRLPWEEFIGCVKHALSDAKNKTETMLGRPGQLKVFFTTDESKERQQFVDSMEGDYGHIYMNTKTDDRETTHVKGEYSKSNGAPGPHPALVDWYILGECHVIAGTFTTFTHYAGARTGLRPAFYRTDAHGCGHFPNDKLTNDIF